jgi:hypothetical protein
LPGFDAAAAFKAERTAYEAVDHAWALSGAEEGALKVLRAALGKQRGA